MFTAIVTGSEVARKKPFPDIYLKGAEMVGELPGACLVVEDALSGIKAGQDAGMDTMGVPTTFTPEQLQTQAQPTGVIEEIGQLGEWLLNG